MTLKNSPTCLFASTLFLALSVISCDPNSERIENRQASQGSCQLVQSDFGPNGTDAVHLETVAQGLETPWGLAFLPGGDILLTERAGRVRLIKNGTLVNQPVAQIQVTETGEGGLLGIVLHPDFATNSFFYVYETVTENGALTNRIERYILSSDHTTATLDRVIFDGIAGGNVHDGGRMHFGPDRMLYVSTGNAGDTNLSQDAGSLNGKILRLTPDGGIPQDNPQAGSALFLNGLRNSQGFDWLDAQTLVVSDNGPTGEYQGRTGGDEISIAHAGDNLGWPTIWHCESQPGLLTPILSWVPAVPPGGLTIYRGNSIPGWNGNVIVASTGGEHLHRIVLGPDNTVAKHEVYFGGASGKGRLREVITSPSGELYVTTSNCDGRGVCPPEGDLVLKVVPGAGAPTPAAPVSRISRFSRQPQSVTPPTQPLALSGQVNYADGTPATNLSISFKATGAGDHLFDQGPDSCAGDEHMQGVDALSVPTSTTGGFEFKLLPSDLVSKVNSNCQMQTDFSSLASLTLQATVDADVPGCAAYCKATSAGSPSSGASCVSECLTGERKLMGSHTFSKSDLSQSVMLSASISLDKLGPSLSGVQGPDLIVDGQAAQTSAEISVENFEASDCAVIEGCVPGPGQRKLLRFDGVIQNVGDSDFVLGIPEENRLFAYSSCHEHYHLQDIMLYELLDPVSKKPILVNGAAVVGRKQGFCLIDNDQIAGSTDGKYDCDNQGITPGWSDNYDHSLDCQWLDVTGVPAGNYLLRITANPSGRYSEANSSNNSSEVPVQIQ